MVKGKMLIQFNLLDRLGIRMGMSGAF